MGPDTLFGALVETMTRHLFVRSPAALLTVLIMLSAVPAAAQVDLSGYWSREGDSDNGYSREPVDLLGIPVSGDGRAKALSYDIASLSATEPPILVANSGRNAAVSAIAGRVIRHLPGKRPGLIGRKQCVRQ